MSLSENQIFDLLMTIESFILIAYVIPTVLLSVTNSLINLSIFLRLMSGELLEHPVKSVIIRKMFNKFFICLFFRVTILKTKLISKSKMKVINATTIL